MKSAKANCTHQRTYLSTRRPQNNKKKKSAKLRQLQQEQDKKEDEKEDGCPISCSGSGLDSDTTTEDEEEELVFVCPKPLEGFCTKFYPSIEHVRAQREKTQAPHRNFTLTIPSYEETPEGVVFYRIQLQTQHKNTTFSIQRRFSEFVLLANQLATYPILTDKKASEVPDIPDGRPFHWQLPPKTWFRMTGQAALDERRDQLEQALLDLLAQEDGTVCKFPLLRDFLQLEAFQEQCQ